MLGGRGADAEVEHLAQLLGGDAGGLADGLGGGLEGDGGGCGDGLVEVDVGLEAVAGGHDDGPGDAFVVGDQARGNALRAD